MEEYFNMCQAIDKIMESDTAFVDFYFPELLELELGEMLHFVIRLN